ncbi:ribosome recycling factor [Blattabacterium cuenoti]
MDELNNIFFSCRKDMKKIIEKLKEDVHYLRLGSKFTASFLSKMNIKCYGTFLPMMEIANITIIDNMNISIQPWDRSIISNIDKAIIDANLGFMPTNKGDSIHINLPIITEEERKNLIKKVKMQIEHAKVLIRNIRKKSNQNIKKLKISEDLLKSGEIRIQKITIEYIKEVDNFLKNKEIEILKI